MKNFRYLTVLLLLAVIPEKEAFCQECFSLKQCLDYAIGNNWNLQKDKLGLETSILSRRELIGSFLPQVSASSGLTYNIQKTTIAMPNFINSMMPEPMRDPNADKYMTVTMGMDYSANWGASLSQQLINFSLYNALAITDETAGMTELGIEISENEIIAQTASIYYNIQVLEYAVSQFDESLGLMDRTLAILSVNKDNGLMRQIDVDRVTVARTNLETERTSMVQAMEIQKNLLKLQMGYQMTDALDVEPIDIDVMESRLRSSAYRIFEVEKLLPYQLMQKQKNLVDLQYKSAVYENLPSLGLSANYSMNYMGDSLKSESLYHFPVSMISLSLRVPIFSGFSKTAKVKKARIEQIMAQKDEEMLVQSLTMSHSNASMQLEQQLRIIDSQRRNKELAEQVFDVTEYNFNEGISSLSDVLNVSSSLIEARMNYVNALSNGMKAYIDLKKADGSISEINK